jgi:hypothetical protein
MGCISDRREKTIAQTPVGIHMTKELQTQNKEQRMAPHGWPLVRSNVVQYVGLLVSVF